MSVSIVVPFSPGDPERDRNWAYLRSRYESLYPDWEIVERGCPPPWRKGIAVNAAVEASSGDVLVIADADVMIAADALRDAVQRLEDSAWVVPHRLVYRLNAAATEALIEGRLRTDPVPVPKDQQVSGSPRRGPAGGGLSVMRREDFVGMDERFIDWGGEDISFARALDTLIGSHRCLGQAMWHLYHRPMHGEERRGSPDSEALAGKYLEASGNPVAMQELLDQRPYEGMVGGGLVVTNRETLDKAPLDPRFAGWGQEDESFGIGLACLAGPPGRGEADLVHLHHAPAKRLSRTRGSRQSWDLRVRYLQARNDPVQMSSLIEEARGSLAAHFKTMHPDSPVGVG